LESDIEGWLGVDGAENVLNFASRDRRLSPKALNAETDTEYSRLEVNCSVAYGVLPLQIFTTRLLALSDEYNAYPVIGEPPSSDGLSQVRPTSIFFELMTSKLTGAAGAQPARKDALTRLVPQSLIAHAVNELALVEVIAPKLTDKIDGARRLQTSKKVLQIL
jgi:hypothetical protein